MPNKLIFTNNANCMGCMSFEGRRGKLHGKGIMELNCGKLKSASFPVETCAF